MNHVKFNLRQVLKDKEYRRLMISVLIVFILGATISQIIVIEIIEDINKKYINQNISMVGKINEVDGDLQDIISNVILDNDLSGYDEGLKIMEKYSYTDKVEATMNPLTKDALYYIQILIPIIWIVGFILAQILIIIFAMKVNKNIQRLNKKVEDIVEYRFYESNADEFEEGTFNKFNQNFDLMQDRMKNSIDTISLERDNLKNIINDISHQLKTPLSSLIMYNDIIMEYSDEKNNDVVEFTNLSKEQLLRMEWLIYSLLKFAKIESKSVQYIKKEESLVDIIYECMSVLSIKSKEKNQDVKFKFIEDVEFKCDRNWIIESLVNIIKNAIEHTPEGGNIEIELDETPLLVEIKIKDNGKGIDNKEIRKIFERFYKSPSNTNPQSVGIGLALSKSIIESHDGSIYVDSELGKGTTFRIVFLKL